MMRFAGRVALVGWFAALVVVSAIMLGRHLLPVPMDPLVTVSSDFVARFRLPDDGGVRLERTWVPFWSAFADGVRNAVDHGIETPEERKEKGKSEHGAVVLRAKTEGAELVIEIADDGRGIDWAAVREKANRAGLPSDGDEALQAALFSDGLSTAEQVTSLSGRGVGMGALREATHTFGGRLVVESSADAGTTVRMTFPNPDDHDLFGAYAAE